MTDFSEIIVDARTGETTVRPFTNEEIAAFRAAHGRKTADYARAIDRHVEDTAKGKGYNGAVHMASYVNSTVPAWAAEATIFIAWRDAVWVTALQIMQRLDGSPSIESVIDMLPVVDWGVV